MKLRTLKSLPATKKRGGPNKLTVAVFETADQTGEWVEFPKEFRDPQSSSSHFTRRYPKYEFAARNGRLYCRCKPGAK